MRQDEVTGITGQFSALLEVRQGPSVLHPRSLRRRCVAVAWPDRFVDDEPGSRNAEVSERGNRDRRDPQALGRKLLEGDSGDQRLQFGLIGEVDGNELLRRSSL